MEVFLIFYIFFAGVFCIGFSDDDSSIVSSVVSSLFLGWFFFPYILGKVIAIELNNIKKQNK